MTPTDLDAEIQALDNQLLTTFVTDFPDPPSRSEVISINAYLVLTHGCIEEYVEALFEDFAPKLLAGVSAGAPVSRAVAMAAFAWSDRGKKTAYDLRTLEDVLKAGANKISEAVPRNHGVKRTNLAELGQAAGIEWPAFEAVCQDAITWLDTLGAKRGSVAHVSTSRTQITKTPVYPPEARLWVADAVAGVTMIQAYLDVLVT